MIFSKLDIVLLIKHLHNSLKQSQKKMFASFFESSNELKYVIHCSRRLGKTYFLCVLSIIFAVKKSNAQIRYASVTQKSVRKMVHPIFKEIFSRLPPKYKGVWNSQEGAYIFKNGSMVHVAGVNNQHEDDLRGTHADLAIIDEAAYVDRLDYLVTSVLIPQLITIPDSRLIIASSSPLSPAHEFSEYIHAAKLSGAYSDYSIYEGGYSDELIEKFCKETGGANSTAWRREYLNELIVDTEFSIIPEWQDSFIQEIIHDEKYEYHHKYRSLDIGVRDKTIGINAHYNFEKAKLFIEDEFAISGIETTTKNINAKIDETDIRCGWNKKTEIYLSVADNNNLILLNDLANEFGKHYTATTKESLAAMINAARLFIGEGRLVVSPRCEQLIGCLKYGVYQDNKRKEFGRSRSFGHYDALAALIYLIRNIDQQTNPVPIFYSQNQFVRREKISERNQAFIKIFKR